MTTLPRNTFSTLSDDVFTVCDEIDEIAPGRTLQDILTHLVTEVGELATEIQIQDGKSYKVEGKDGIVGEAVDVIACALDIIHTAEPKFNDLDLRVIMRRKLKKWKETQCPSVE